MKKDWKYILYIVFAAALFVGVKMISPKQYNWNITYSHEDKNPYGAYALNALLPDLFNGSAIEHSYRTIYELKDSLRKQGNIFVVATRFNCAQADTDALLRFIEEGGSAFISAQYFLGDLRDTLKLSTSDYFFQQRSFFNRKDTASLRFVNPAFDTTLRFHYRRDNIHNYFGTFDTLRATVIARNDLGLPVTIKIPIGKGTLVLNSTPIVFTNIYALFGHNHEFIANTLSYLPSADVQWTEYYQFGRMEIRTPLRFILTTEPLRWAYYISVLSLLAFMIFEMKRRQRVIPVIKPPENTSLEFVSTIGNLYFQNKEHKNIAEKKILFLMEHIRTKHSLGTTRIDEPFVLALSKKSGQPEDELRRLFKTIEAVRSSPRITREQLIHLNTQIEKCNL